MNEARPAKPRWLLMRHMLERLQVARPTVHRWVNEGYLPPPTKLGSLLAWPVETIERWEAERAATPYSPSGTQRAAAAKSVEARRAARAKKADESAQEAA